MYQQLELFGFNISQACVREIVITAFQLQKAESGHFEKLDSA